MKRLVCATVLGLSTLAAPAVAQVAPLNLPQPSQEASISQTVGLTKIDITYHRPAVNKRKVWGELVPYGEVWRAGANENTTITFSTPVKVNGQALAAGTYGLHMLPAEKEFTVIFSKNPHLWGAFGYDQKEDALRVTTTPVVASEHEERMAYTFDNPSNTGTEVSLRWEKLRVPFKVEVDTKTVVVASLREQLRGLPQFFWQSWNQAANYCQGNDVNLDEALTWADKSISMNENFTNVRTKAAIVEKKGDKAMAAELRAKAGKLAATEAEVNQFGYTLLGEKKVDEAIEVFKKNVKDHPNSWNCYDSLAEGYANKGDKAQAAQHYQKALDMTKDETQRKRIKTEMAKLKG